MMKQLLRACTTILLSIGLFAFDTHAAAEKRIPSRLHHQGRMVTATGQPVTGTKVLILRIFDQPSGGRLLHEESKTVVFDADGLFDVQIGSDVPLDIEDLVDPNETTPEALRYLEVEVDGDGPMPRIQLLSSPYALGAYRVAGDFLSAPNEILMIDSAGDTTATLASKKLFVGGLSWGVAVDSSGSTEVAMHSLSGTNRTTKTDKVTPLLTEAVCRTTSASDSASSQLSLSNAGALHSLSHTDGGGTRLFKAEGTPLRAKVEVQSDPGSDIVKSGFMETDSDGSRIRLSTENTSGDEGLFWLTDLKPGATGGVTQTLIARASPTDSSLGQIKVDSSEVRLRMNKGELISEIASNTGSAHVSLTDISASDKGKFVMQHNQTDLDFVMRLHNSADTAQVRMQATATGPELQLSTESGGTTQNVARVTHESYALTKAQLSVQETVFEVDANGTATGASLRVRYPSVAGGAAEVLLGDLNGDAIPDLSVAGHVGIGSATPTEKLHVAGNICVTGGYLTCSDARYKSDVEPIHGAIDQLQKLQGVEFNWRREDFADRDFPEDRQMGFVAQEVQQVLPGVVSEGTDGYLAMDYARLTPLLVEALKAQQERIDRLEALLLQLTERQATR